MVDILERKLQDLASGGVSDQAVASAPVNLDAKLESLARPESDVNLDVKLETLSAPIEDPAQELPRVVWDEVTKSALEVPGWYHGGQIGKALRENFNPKKEDVGEIGRAFMRGWLQLPEAVGEAVRFIGDHIGSSTPFGGAKPKDISDFESKVQKRILDQGDLITNTWKDLQKSASINGVELTRANPDIWKGDFMDNPSYTRGVATLLQAIPSLAVGYIASVAGGTAFAGAAVAGMIDGLQTRGEARAAGKTVAEQDLAGGAVAIVNGILELDPMSRFLKGGKGKIAGALEGFASEGTTEALQQFWQNSVAKIGYESSRDLMAGVVESLIVGGATGGALGGFTSNTSKKIDQAFNKLRLAGVPEVQIDEMTYNMAVEIAKNSDVPILETTLEDGSKVKLTLDAAIAARMDAVARQTESGQAKYENAIPPLTPQETVESAGGVFKGMQEGFKKPDGSVVEGRVLFDGPSQSTMSLKVSEVTPDKVEAKIAAKEAEFERGKPTPKEVLKQSEPNPDPVIAKADAIESADLLTAAEEAVRADPDNSETLQSQLPQWITDLQTVTAKINDLRSRGEVVPDSLKFAQKSRVQLLEDLQNSILATQAAPNLQMKGVIRRMTGQVEFAPKMVTEMSALKASLHAMVKTASDTTRSTTRDLNNLKKGLVEEIKKAIPPSKERGAFLSSIASAKDGVDIMVLGERVEKAAEKYKRKELVKEIKRQVKKAEASGVIAVEYVSEISDLMDSVDQGMTPELRKRLEKTQRYIDKQRESGNDISVPQHIVDEIQGLYRDDLQSMDSNSLQELLGEIVLLRDLGRTKLGARRAIKEAYVSQALIELAVGSRPMSTISTVVNPFGESLSVNQKLKNAAADVQNWIANNQRGFTFIDTVIDQLDGNAGYSGPNFRIFKSPANAGVREQMNIKDPISSRVVKLAKKLELDAVDMNKIGFYAVKVQEGGAKKLESMGYSEEFISKFELTPAQAEQYIAFRSELDSIWPKALDVLRRVYNLNPESVQQYFPFSTDFDALNSKPISERFNADTPDLIDTLLKGQTPGYFKKTNPDKSFSIERVNGKQAVRLNAMQVFLNHIDNVSYLIAMGERLDRMAAIARDPGYFEAVGDQGQRFMLDWIDVLARNGRRTDQIGLVDGIRKNAGNAALAFRLSSILVQGTALMDGASTIGPAVFEGAAKVATSKQWREFVRDNMPELRNRIGDDPFYSDFGSKSNIDKFNEKGFWALQKFDLLTATSVAVGAYAKYMRENNLPFDFNDPSAFPVSQEGLAYAQDIVGRSQASALPKDLPLAFTKSHVANISRVFDNTSVNRLIMQFQLFALKRWDTLTHQGIDLGVAKGDIAKSVNVASFLLLAKLAEAGTRGTLTWVIQHIISAVTGSDPDPEDTDSLAFKAAMNILSDIPFANMVSSTTQYGSIPVPAIQLISRTISRVYGAVKAKEGSTKVRNSIRASLLAAGIVAGVGSTTQVEDIYAKATAEKVSYY